MHDLAGSLEEIKISVRKHWREVDLRDFTDHGYGHSERVAAFAELLATVRPMPEQYELTLLERYLLTAAAWLHDVGMQDLRPDSTEDLGTVAKASAVRSTHARRSEEMIRKSEIDMGLPSNEIKAPEIVALLALAHGTSTYKSTLSKLDAKAKTFKSKKIRPRLLAALLLMADELDLHYERVPPATKFHPLNHESAAHWLKHECVSDVDLREVNGEVRVIVAMMTPEYIDAEEDRPAIREWIVSKLRQQIALTEQEIEEGFNGHFRFSRRIEVIDEPADRESNFYRPESMAFVMRENMESRLINHRSCLGATLGALERPGCVALVGPLGAEGDDISGREDILSAVIAKLRTAGWEVLRNSSLDVTFGVTEVSEIIESWMHEAGFELPMQVTETEIARRNVLLDSLIAGLANTPEKEFLLALSGVDFGSHDRKWIVEAFSRICALDNVRCIVSTDRGILESDWSEDLSALWQSIEVGDTPLSESTDYLARFMRFEDADINARSHEGSYVRTKSLALQYTSKLLQS